MQLIEGGEGIDTIDQVLAGNAQYGVTNSEVLLRRLQGAPLTIIAAIFQHSPLVLVARQDAGIFTPQDLLGKTVVLSQSSRDLELLATLQIEGVNLENLKIQDRLATREDYFDPSIDAISAYITNQPFYYALNKTPHSIIRPSSYGVDFYGDCLFTTEEEVRKHQERVESFRRASLKGWTYAMAHPEEIINLIKKSYDTQKTTLHLQYEAERMKQLIQSDIIEIGHINPGRWQHIAEIFSHYGMIQSHFSLDGFFYTDHLRKKDQLPGIPTIAGVIICITGSLIFTLYSFKIITRERKKRSILETALTDSEGSIQKLRHSLNNLADLFAVSYSDADLSTITCKLSTALTEMTGYSIIAFLQFDAEGQGMHIVEVSGTTPEKLLQYIAYNSIGEEQAHLIGLASFQVSRHIFMIPQTLTRILNSSSGFTEKQEKTETQQAQVNISDSLLIFIPGKNNSLLGMAILTGTDNMPSPSKEDITTMEAYAHLLGRHMEQPDRQMAES